MCLYILTSDRLGHVPVMPVEILNNRNVPVNCWRAFKPPITIWTIDINSQCPCQPLKGYTGAPSTPEFFSGDCDSVRVNLAYAAEKEMNTHTRHLSPSQAHFWGEVPLWLRVLFSVIYYQLTHLLAIDVPAQLCRRMWLVRGAVDLNPVPHVVDALSTGYPGSVLRHRCNR